MKRFFPVYCFTGPYRQNNRSKQSKHTVGIIFAAPYIQKAKRFN